LHPQQIELTIGRVPFGAPESVGVSTAPVGVIEFADFQCPFCADFARSVFPQIRAKYIDRGLVRFDFRNFPLPIHPLARSAALAGECLTKFRNFSAAQDFLFGAAPGATAKGLAPAAEALGLAPSTLESCSRNPTFVASD
jgi:protein-disulfide isomerase